MIKNCVICGKEFKAKRKQSIACSRTCGGKAGQLKKIKRKCSICGAEKETSPSNNFSKPFYCSDTCRKQRYKLECKNCGISFRSCKPYGKYCSQHCRVESYRRNKVKITCTVCKKEFSRPSFTVREGNLFCSQKCRNRYHSVHPSKKYGSKWSRISLNIRKRDNYTCKNCGTQSFEKYAMDVHHIVPPENFDSFDEANHPDNLITLCRKCHDDIHKIIKTQKK